jgi:hypothetical protein
MQVDTQDRFYNEILDMLTKNSSANNTLFSKERNIVHGRPRHPQSQGSVERANVDVKEMLATWLSENNSTPWFEGLRFIQIFRRHIKNFIVKSVLGIHLHLNSLLL